MSEQKLKIENAIPIRVTQGRNVNPNVRELLALLQKMESGQSIFVSKANEREYRISESCFRYHLKKNNIKEHFIVGKWKEEEGKVNGYRIWRK